MATPQGEYCFLHDFAGLTPFGGKVHRCFGNHSAACNDSSWRINHFNLYRGPVKKENLCQKCWGKNPSIEYLSRFSIELTPA